VEFSNERVFDQLDKLQALKDEELIQNFVGKFKWNFSVGDLGVG